MSPDEQLCHTLTESRLLCATCPDCETRPIITYEPGSTTAKCECRAITLPDWEPRNVMRVWNGCIIRGNFREKTIRELIKKFTK